MPTWGGDTLPSQRVPQKILQRVNTVSLGPDLLSSAFGLLTAIRGTAGLMGPPLAGFAVDYFNDKYDEIE